MPRWLYDLDRVLRGQATRAEDLQGGRLELPIGRLSLALIGLGVVYGACMGSFTLWRADGPLWMQLLSTSIKVPALFLLTLLVTFPSLYVFNAIVGSRLDVATVFRLLIVGLVVTTAVLASLGPIVAFFGACTTSYPFMKLLNVLVFSVSGLLGLSVLLRTLERLSRSAPAQPAIPPANPGEVPAGSPNLFDSGPLQPANGEALSPHVKTVFRCWVVLFGVVGAQMAWILRPFLGAPTSDFAWFRPRSSNFLEAVVQSITHLFK